MRPLAVAVAVLMVVAPGCLQRDSYATLPNGMFEEGMMWLPIISGSLVKKAGESAAVATHVLELPERLTAVSARLTTRGEEATFELRTPDGKSLAPVREKAGQSSLVTMSPPAGGEWVATVSSTANATSYVLQITLFRGPVSGVGIGAMVPLAKGGVAEADVVIEEGVRIGFDFKSTRPVLWDVHTHDAQSGEAVIHAEGAASEEGKTFFTAPARGLYSISFTPQDKGGLLQYRVSGVMLVHSYIQG